jgi:leukotriene-A4 hydrolase
MVPDGSQIYVATHEIAHSWTGNYVTCQDWSNLWLNEGFTTFIERRVSYEVDGKDFSYVESLLGNSSFYDDMLGFGVNSSYSSLYPQVGNRAPDSASSQVTYEKGQQFMYYLLSVMDSEDDFRDFLAAYLTDYKWQSITFLEVRISFNKFVLEKYGPVKG